MPPVSLSSLYPPLNEPPQSPSKSPAFFYSTQSIPISTNLITIPTILCVVYPTHFELQHVPLSLLTYAGKPYSTPPSIPRANSPTIESSIYPTLNALLQLPL